LGLSLLIEAKKTENDKNLEALKIGRDLTAEEAIRFVINEFPFKDFMIPGGREKGAYANITNFTLRYLKRGSRILDFGSGACDKTAILQLLGFRCCACDDLQEHWHKIPGNREKIIDFAKKCGIDFRPVTKNALLFEKNSFDMIMLNDVLEHLHNSPCNLLNDLLELLKPNGLLFVTVPNAVNIRKRVDVFFGRTNLPPFDCYYWYPDSWRGHVREYVRDDLVKLASYLNLEVLQIKNCDHMLERLFPVVHPAYLFVTKLFPGWKDTWLLLAKKTPGWMSRKKLPEDELIRILEKSSLYKYNE